MAKTRTRTTKASKTTSINAYNSIGDMANDVRHVLKSIIARNDKYSVQQASVVSKLYNSELTRMKLQVDVAKMNHKTSKVSTTDVLSLD